MTDNNTSMVNARVIGFAVLALFFVTVNRICTQCVAGRLGHDQASVQPFLGRLYRPFEWWKWMFKRYQRAPNNDTYVVSLFAAWGLVAMLNFVLFVGFKWRCLRKNMDIQGAAHVASYEKVTASGLTLRPGPGVYCDAYDDSDGGRTLYLRHDNHEYVCALASTRSVQWVGLVILHLLSWRYRTFVLDHKGGHDAMTAGWCKEQVGNVVQRFDPVQPSDGCGRKRREEIRYRMQFQTRGTQNIAFMVVDHDRRGIEGEHFRIASDERLAGVIPYARSLQDKAGRYLCLQACAHILTDIVDFAVPDTANHLGESPDSDLQVRIGSLTAMRDMKVDTQDVADREEQQRLAGDGRRMREATACEIHGIVSAVNNAFSLCRDPLVGERVGHIDCRVSDRMDHDKPVFQYAITTPRNADRVQHLMAAEAVMPRPASKKNDHDEMIMLGEVLVFDVAQPVILGTQILCSHAPVSAKRSLIASPKFTHIIRAKVIQRNNPSIKEKEGFQR